MINKAIKIVKDERLGIPFLIVLGVGANFLKEMLVAYYYGASEVVDLFKIATSVPVSFFQSLGAVYVGLFLPYVLDTSPTKIIVLTRKVMLVSIALMLIGVPLSFFYPELFAPGMDERLSSKLVTQGLLCWIGFGFLLFTFQRRIWLQAHNRKNVVSATSFINSFAFIISATVFISLIGVNEWVLIASFLVSCIVVLMVYGVACEKKITIFMQVQALFQCRHKGKVAYSVIVIAVMFHATQLIPRIIDRSYASYGGEGAIAHLEYAYNFYTALGMVIGTSLVILLSRDVAETKKLPEVVWRKIVKKAGGFVAASILGAMIVAFFSEEIVSLIYMRGEFDSYDMKATSGLLRFLIIGVPIMVINMLLLQVAYTYGAVRILLVAACFKVIAKYLSIEFLSNYEYEYMFGMSNMICELCFLVVLIWMISKVNNGRGLE